jgi:hypothetical protein
MPPKKKSSLPKYWYAEWGGWPIRWDPKLKKHHRHGFRWVTQRRVLKANDPKWVKDKAKSQALRADYWERKVKRSQAAIKKQNAINRLHRKKK